MYSPRTSSRPAFSAILLISPIISCAAFFSSALPPTRTKLNSFTSSSSSFMIRPPRMLPAVIFCLRQLYPLYIAFRKITIIPLRFNINLPANWIYQQTHYSEHLLPFLTVLIFFLGFYSTFFTLSSYNDIRNDMGLSPRQTERYSSWVNDIHD